MSVNTTPSNSNDSLSIENENESGVPDQIRGPTMGNLHLFPERRSGSSNASLKSNRSFELNDIYIPQTTHAHGHNSDNTVTRTKPSSLSTVSSIDTTNCNTQDFVQSAPVYGDVNVWDKAIAQDALSAMDLANVMEYDHADNAEQMPDFMKSNFFMPMSSEITRRTSTESMQSLTNPHFPAPQSAPAFGFMPPPPQPQPHQLIFGTDTIPWPLMMNDAFYQAEPHTQTVSEADIFGSEVESAETAASAREPFKISGVKRNRGQSLSEADRFHLGAPPLQRVKLDKELPPMLTKSKRRKRGRPRKSEQTSTATKQKKDGKYSKLSKSDREKLRRKELKNGYHTLTEMLHLNSARAGSTLPDRSVIISAACDEIQRLEQMLFSLSSPNKM